MKYNLKLVDSIEYQEEPVEIEPSEDGYTICLYIDQKKTLEEQLKNKEKIIQAIDDYYCYSSLFEDTDEYNDLEDLKRSVLLDEIDIIELDLINIDVLEFIDNNPIIQKRKIFIPKIIELSDYNYVKELLVKYNKYKDNIYVYMRNNQSCINLSECFTTLSKIKEQADRILSLNLSPMETIMYTYDQVRNRIFQAEKDGEAPSKSRELSSVLNGDAIVCAGYSVIFKTLLQYMNIKCSHVIMNEKGTKNGHERNVIYIKDEKYDIDGVYYFDVTWDSKTANETNEFLNRYRFFAKTRKEMVEYENDKFDYWDYDCCLDNIVPQVKKIFEKEKLVDIYNKFGSSINSMSRLVEGKRLIEFEDVSGMTKKQKINRDEFLEKLNQIVNKFNKPIPAETFIRLLNNVRKIEFYENPEFYPYTIDRIYETYIRSDWKFEKHYYNDEQKFLMSIFGNPKNDFGRNLIRDDFINFVREEMTTRDILGVKFTKILQEYSKKN